LAKSDVGGLSVVITFRDHPGPEGETEVEPGLESLGALAVDGAVAQQVEAEAGAELAVALGAVLVVIGEKAAAATVTGEDVGAPERQTLVQRDVRGLSIVVALGDHACPEGESEVEGAVGLTQATGGDVLLDHRDQQGRIAVLDGREDLRETQRLRRDQPGRQQGDERQPPHFFASLPGSSIATTGGKPLS